MKFTHLKLFLSMAIVVGITNVDSTAATKIASNNIGADISAIGIIANQKPIITNKMEIDLIDIGPTIIAANILPIAVDRPIIGSRVAVKDIDIQASLPIIL